MTKHVYCRVAMLNLHFQKLLGATGETTKQAYWRVAMFNLHFEDLWIDCRGDAGDEACWHVPEFNLHFQRLLWICYPEQAGVTGFYLVGVLSQVNH